MPKIIFTSQYMKDAPPAHLKNYVKYIGTREGVEKIDTSKQFLPATVKQRQLINQMIRDIPSSKNTLEYTDYKEHSTRGNATEFISLVLEQNLNLIDKKENYVEYIAGRPRVERIGEHGLFTDAGVPVVLSKVQEDICKHKGAVWTHVISLRREDAERLGYDSGRQWQNLLRSKKAMFSKHMKIDCENLRWYAAFHNESHHPHVHLMVYSAKDNDGFLTEKSIEAMRSELAHDIFRQDFAHIYEKQNLARADLKAGTADVLRKMMDALQSGTVVNPEIEKQMVRLSERLQNTGGKKVYGYLKRDVKNLIDQIVDELAKESRVNALYQAWGKWNNEVLLTYRKETPSLPPLSAQPQFKSMKNMVITEAMKLGGHHVTFEDEQMQESDISEEEISEHEPDAMAEHIPERHESEWSGSTHRHGTQQGWWTEQYKRARQYLYSGKEQDFDKAFELLLLEAESGNAFAMHDLGRMLTDGLGREIDLTLAQEWYAKALAALIAQEHTVENKRRPYLQYRIGKMYAAGLGTEQSYETAAEWFSQAVSANHKYAQYSLGGLYYRGQGVEKDYAQAFHLYASSATQGNPYASYELGKMYRDRLGTAKNIEAAGEHFQNAFSGFLRLEQDSHDDKLQYRLGQMLHTGTGTEQNDAAAADYWERSARLGNVNAQYALGKLWLENGTGDLEKAVAWITKAADGGNAAAQYSLGKLYRDGRYVERNIEKAVELFTLSAEQKNEYAAYALGRLYLSGEGIQKDVQAAVRWLTLSADQNNPFAQYTLGKQYLTGEDIPKDTEKAIRLLVQSAEQENQFAAYQLGKLYLVGEAVPKDVETAVRWLIKSAEQSNQFAQYQLGKLYLAGEDAPKDVEMAVQWLTKSAEQENQFAQYALGKLYLCGRDIPRDKEKAIPLLEAAAAQGNIYAEFLLEHLDSFRDPSAFLAATRLLHQLENLFRDDYRKATGGNSFHIDRKRRRRLQEKKQAQGHAHNDHEQQTQY